MLSQSSNDKSAIDGEQVGTKIRRICITVKQISSIEMNPFNRLSTTIINLDKEIALFYECENIYLTLPSLVSNLVKTCRRKYLCTVT